MPGPARNTDASLSAERAGGGTASGGRHARADHLACPDSVGPMPAVALAWPRLSISLSNSGSVHRRSGTAGTRHHTGDSDDRRGPCHGSKPAGLDFFSASCDPRPCLVGLVCTGTPTRARSANSGPSVYLGAATASRLRHRAWQHQAAHRDRPRSIRSTSRVWGRSFPPLARPAPP